MQQPGPGANYPRGAQPTNGILILVLGILSLVGFGCLTGIPAWLIGNNAMVQIRAGNADRSEESMVNIGRLLGIIGTCLSLCGVLIWFGLMVLGIGAAAIGR